MGCIKVCIVIQFVTVIYWNNNYMTGCLMIAAVQCRMCRDRWALCETEQSCFMTMCDFLYLIQHSTEINKNTACQFQQVPAWHVNPSIASRYYHYGNGHTFKHHLSFMKNPKGPLKLSEYAHGRCSVSQLNAIISVLRFSPKMWHQHKEVLKELMMSHRSGTADCLFSNIERKKNRYNLGTLQGYQD